MDTHNFLPEILLETELVGPLRGSGLHELSVALLPSVHLPPSIHMSLLFILITVQRD